MVLNGVGIGVVIDHSIDVIQIDVILEGGSLLWVSCCCTHLTRSTEATTTQNVVRYVTA